MRIFDIRPFVLCTCLLLAACGEKPKPPVANPSAAKPEVPVAGTLEDTGDFGLGQEWVESMLKENAQTLARMREELDGMRRELERMENAGQAVNAEQIKQAMARMLDKQEAELRKLHEQAGEMRKVMAAEAVE